MVSARAVTASKPRFTRQAVPGSRFLAAFVVACIALAQVAVADLGAGMQRFEQGDYEGAARELEPDARGGDPRAQHLLGIMYLNELVPEPGPEAAASWLRKAAEQDYVEAQTELARMYRTGHAVPQDYAEMARWYGRAAQLGDVGAQLFVADSYAYGYGVPVDYVQAYMWYEIAIQYWGPLAVRARDVIAEKMTPEEVAEATTLAAKSLSEMAE